MGNNPQQIIEIGYHININVIIEVRKIAFRPVESFYKRINVTPEGKCPK